MPKFSDYRAVVFNYDAPDDRWSGALKTAFDQYVSNGGGLVSVHAADNAFPGWDRVQRDDRHRRVARTDREAGAYWFYKDGTLQSDASAGPAGSHGARVPFKITCAHGRPSHHERLAARLDAPGRRAVREAARAGEEHDRAGHGLLGSRQRGQRP
jgi:hypothetical protein